MPYRYAHHLILLLLVPVILYAFWPNYFGDLPRASFAFHAHGLTATAWILLVATQSWTVQSRRFALHRSLGRVVFVLVPLFAGGAALAMRGMAIKYLTKSDPFYAMLGPLLGLDDLISATALVLFVRAALVHWRRAHLHGGYMLCTVLLVFPPILSRLGLPVSPAWHLGELIPGSIAALLFLNAPRHGRPFLVLIGFIAFRYAADTLFGFSPQWLAVFTRLPSVWPPALAAVAVAVAFATLWSAWRPMRWRPPLRSATAPGS